MQLSMKESEYICDFSLDTGVLCMSDLHLSMFSSVSFSLDDSAT